MATHGRVVIALWLLVLAGTAYALPKVEKALAGFGWAAVGSESVQARDRIGDHFAGRNSAALTVVVHSDSLTVRDRAFRDAIADVERILREHPEDVASVTPPRPGQSISPDGRTAVVVGGAAREPNGMVAAADELKVEFTAASRDQVDVNLTGLPGMWSDFNEDSKESMFFSEAVSWPVTLAVLALAFGSLAAAALPLPLTLLGMATAGGALWVGTQIIDISLWAMNFALMFSLALGIDYALFVVMRFRQAMFEDKLEPVEATGRTMDTAGKAVVVSGITVILSLAGVLWVPSPAFRTMSIGIILSVIFVLAAALTLLPVLLAKLGPRVNRFALPGLRGTEFRSERSAAWAKRLWRHPWPYGIAALAILGALCVPLLHTETRSPSIDTVFEGQPSHQGHEQLQRAFGSGAPGMLQTVGDRDDREEIVAELSDTAGVVRTNPPQTSDSQVLVEALPAAAPNTQNYEQILERVRAALPAETLTGGAAAEAVDLEDAADTWVWVVIPFVLGLGFLLVLFAFRSVILAAATVATNLLATAAAFGVGTLIFQDGFLAGLFAVDPQGYLNVWVPVFFFAMIFGLAMDYSVFLLAATREQWDDKGEPEHALVEGMARSGRVIFSAAAVMVAVFFTFAIASSALPPIEMGVILGVAVVIEAGIVRLLLMPVIIRLAGRAAWWMPQWLAQRVPKLSWGH